MIVIRKQGIAAPFRAASPARAWGILFAAVLLGFAGHVRAQAQKRCDLIVKSTPGAGTDSTCLDLVSLANGGTAIQTAGNVTRISRTGLRFCKNAFQVQTGAEADVVFIFDNSGSMFAQLAWVDPATNDTTFYNGPGGCADRTTSGTFTLQTANGPLVCAMLNSNAGCRDYSGDPYEVRAQVIKTAIDYMARTSPTSTAGITGFALTTMHPLAPLQLNVPANVAQVKDSALIDSVGSTNYGPPLRLAYGWLRNPAVVKTAKHAIVFISDGAPNDGGRNGYLAIVDSTIPIFSIFLGHTSTADTANLKQLSDLTHGTFNRVDPKNIAGINQVMQSIIQSLLLTTVPRSIEVTNTSLAPPQISRSTNLVRNADSSMSLSLDSIIGLRLGSNDLQVKITMNDTLTRTYAVKVQADGPIAPASTSEVTCYDPPVLTLLNAQGKPDTAYLSGTADYTVKLTRATNDLSSVLVTSVSRDSARGPAWGDAESVLLNLAGAGNTYQGAQPLNGGSVTPTAHNGTLESDASGKVILSWVHPRDPREFANYELPGQRIPVIPPFIEVERVRDVTRGEVIDGAIQDPVVVYGGANLVRTSPDSAHVTYGGCLSNCTTESIRLGDPGKIPSFVFKTASPFSYAVKIYDNLGNFVNESNGSVDAAKWLTMPRKGDSVAVVMSVLPVARNGAMVGSGVYILRAIINAQAGASHNGLGNETLVPAGSRIILNRFGYLRSSR
ncbi:MAG: von Willebrand factor type domain [Fibrobacteres bacterium]|nr:von Willebrand factor type domain [Fibrobacterota bacterium]